MGVRRGGGARRSSLLEYVDNQLGGQRIEKVRRNLLGESLLEAGMMRATSESPLPFYSLSARTSRVMGSTLGLYRGSGAECIW